jgi:hypothetical protein
VIDGSTGLVLPSAASRHNSRPRAAHVRLRYEGTEVLKPQGLEKPENVDKRDRRVAGLKPSELLFGPAKHALQACAGDSPTLSNHPEGRLDVRRGIFHDRIYRTRLQERVARR